MEFGNIAIDLVAGFIALFLVTKVLGKTQITQVTPFDFVSALVLGEIVGNSIFDEEIGVWRVLFATVIWGILILGIEIITQRFKGSRKLLEGEPSIVIRKGKIQREVLKKNRLDINQLQHLLRSKDIFSIREVEYALLETDGKVNVLKKAQYSTPSINDMNLPFPLVSIPVTLIIDGEVVKDNLRQINKDETWLNDQIAAFGASNVKDVLYAEWKEGDGIYVDKFS